MNEQLLAIIKATIVDPTLAATLTAKLTEQKFVVRTAAEEEQYKNNLLATVDKESIIKEEKRIWMRRVEDDVKELTGLTQKSSEPYHEFMKRGFAKVQDELKALKVEKEQLEANVKSGNAGDAVIWKQKYETLEQQSKAAIAAKEQELSTLQKTVSLTQRRQELDKAFAPMQSKFIDQLPGFFNDYKEQVLADVVNRSALIDGKLVLVDENGNPRKDSNLNNITVESYLSEKFKDVIKTTKDQPGAGSQPPAPGTPPVPPAAGQAFNVANVPAEITTQGQVVEFLGKQGLLQGTPEFDKAFADTISQKNITKLF